MSPETILNIVADYYNIPVDVITKKCNRIEIVQPRHIAVYFCRIKTSLSVAAIAKIFHYKDHSGSIFGFKQVLKQEKISFEYRQELKEIDTLISNTEKYDEEKLYDIYMENDFYKLKTES